MNPNRKLAPATIEADRESAIGILALKDYRPINAQYGAETLAAQLEAMEQAEENEIRAKTRWLRRAMPSKPRNGPCIPPCLAQKRRLSPSMA